MIKLGIGVAWTFGKINRFVSNMILAFRARVYADGGVFEAPGCLAAQLEELRKDQLLSSASFLVTPNAVEEDKLFAIVPSSGSGDLVVTRATTATRVNSDGLIEVTPYNLFTYSEQFDNAAWTKSNATITANTTISPDGNNNADTYNVVSTTANLIYQNPTLTTGAYSISVYAKKASSNIIRLFNVSSGTSAAWFDLNLGQVIGTVNGGTALIENAGNGWYRCVYKGTSITSGFTGIGLSDTANSATASIGSSVFIWGAQLVSGTSAKEYFPTTDRLDVPRLDYTNSSCPSILVEPQRTNLFTYSEQFDNGAWTKTRTTITANSIISPDGTLTADKISDTIATSTNHIIQFSQPYTSGVSYTKSCFVKNDDIGFFFIQFRANAFGVEKGVYFDIENGNISYQDSGIIAKIEDYGNGWYRCQATATATNTVASTLVGINFGISVNGSNQVYTSTTIKSLYIWGAQLEAGSNATSYVPTVASSVTRNADVISKTGISSLIGQTEGTLFVDFNKTKNNLSILSIDDGTANNRIFLEGTGTSTGLRVRITNGGTTTVDNTSNVLQNGINKIALIYANNNVSLYRNGVLIFNDNSATIPNTSILRIGSNVTNLFQLDDSINSAVIWKTPLTDSQLELLTGNQFYTYDEMAIALNYNIQ